LQEVQRSAPADEDFSGQQRAYKIPFTFVVNPDDQLAIMQEEVFGPLLAIKTYRTLDECIAQINSRPAPLALYIFSDDDAIRRRLLDEIPSGGACINDVMAQRRAGSTSSGFPVWSRPTGSVPTRSWRASYVSEGRMEERRRLDA